MVDQRTEPETKFNYAKKLWGVGGEVFGWAADQTVSNHIQTSLILLGVSRDEGGHSTLGYFMCMK